MSRFHQWRGRFPELTEEWFRRQNVVDARRVFRAWRSWLRDTRHSEDAKFRKALQFSAGISYSAVGHFLSEYRNPEKNHAHELSENTRRKLQAVAKSLGWVPPAPEKILSDRLRRIALFTSIRNVANPRYYLDVLDGILEAAIDRKFSVSINAFDPGLGPDAWLSIRQAIQHDQPDAVVWFRVTPPGEVLDLLQSLPKTVPNVVVHGSRVRYPEPVVSHVIPRQSDIVPAMAAWAQRFVHRYQRYEGVVVLAMQEEEAPPGYEPMGPGITTSLRRDRVDQILQGLQAGLLERPRVIHVENYTSVQAYHAVATCPDASGYVCLSDELAVAIKHLLLTRGEKVEDRIVGFDGSDVAKKNGIPSINQNLKKVGAKVAACVTAALTFARAGGELPRFKEDFVGMGLHVPDRSVTD